MSISGVGAAGSSYLSAILAKMLSQLDGPQSTTSTTSSMPTTSVASTTAPPGLTASNALTGSAQQPLSDHILALLVQLQSQTSNDVSPTSSSPTSTPTSTSVTTTSSSNDPIQQLFAAMDGNGDGIVNQSEMEKYIESQGGTQSQADKLYAALNQNGSNGISESQMASAVENGHHGHHHHHVFDASPSTAASSSTPSASGTNGIASNLFAAIDTNGDGSISQSELSSFLTSVQQQSPFGSSTSAMNGYMVLANQSYNSSAILLNSLDPAQALIA